MRSTEELEAPCGVVGVECKEQRAMCDQRRMEVKKGDARLSKYRCAEARAEYGYYTDYVRKYLDCNLGAMLGDGGSGDVFRAQGEAGIAPTL